MPKKCPPVLFIVYRRPETTKKVFEAIRAARPAQLFIAHDALAPHQVAEFSGRHAEVRKIVTAVDWPCEVHTLFLEEHKNMLDMFTAAFNWFFDHVEEGIMLEDDDLPDATFFPFCAEMLERYRNDERVMSISGSHVLYHSKEFVPKESYYFLSIPSVWGMATWKRAWKKYDGQIKSWPEIRDKKLIYEVLPSSAAAFYFSKKFQDYYDHKINSWDGQWVYACLVNRGLTIYSNKNIVSNIGYNIQDSYHGVQENDLWGNLKLESLSFPLVHPDKVELNKVWDEYGVRVRYHRVDFNLAGKIKWWLKATFPDAYISLKRFFYKTFAPSKYNENNNKLERSLLP